MADLDPPALLDFARSRGYAHGRNDQPSDPEAPFGVVIDSKELRAAYAAAYRTAYETGRDQRLAYERHEALLKDLFRSPARLEEPDRGR